MKAVIKIDKANNKKTINEIMSLMQKTHVKVINTKDANFILKTIVKNAKTGNTGFIFDKSYSKKYVKSKAKTGVSSLFYSPKKESGSHTLNNIRYDFSTNGKGVRIKYYLGDAFSRRKELWHRTGRANNSTKKRQWLGINKNLEARFLKTIAKRLQKLIKKGI